MSPLLTKTLMGMTAFSTSVILAYFYYKLKQKDLFNWTSSGFWAWVAFFIYFVAAPGSAAITGDIDRYDLYLRQFGGTNRAIWILAVTTVGISVFFITYLKSTYKTVTFGIHQKRINFTLPVLGIIFIFILIGFYSLLTHRAGIVDSAGEKIIKGGRFIGDVTGFSHVAHKFMLFPMYLFLLSRNLVFKKIGWFLFGCYFLLSIPHSHSRYITVSLFTALSIKYCHQRRRRMPKASHIAIIILVAIIFQIRGHATWELNDLSQSLSETALKIPERGLKVLGGGVDTAMLASWYAKSALEDQHYGYDYGLPLINYIIAGWIPNKIFPEKYFLVDWLESQRRKSTSILFERILFGAKFTLIGSFYGHGGIIAVIICMGTFGFICRRLLDGMLDYQSPISVKAIAIGWFSTLWMDFGSDDTWILLNWGTIAIPALAVWLFWRKNIFRKDFKRRRMRRLLD